jgi:two-component system response regulator FlrC
VAELKPELQAKLLRVLQERRFERVGGTQTIAANVRWIAATNRDLRAEKQDGRFRDDLYHRLAVFPVRLPPLRERPRDLIPLAETLLARIARELGRRPPRLTATACERLRAAPWPGTVRELANALERAVILADGAELGPEHLVLELEAGVPVPAGDGLRSLASVEREAIERTLTAVGGNRKEAAERLGIGLRTLYDTLKRYRLE